MLRGDRVPPLIPGHQRIAILVILLVWLLVHWGHGVPPLISGHHWVAVLVVLGIWLLVHWPGSAPVHGWITKVDWLRLAPSSPLGDSRRLLWELVRGVTGYVERLRVHRVDWDLWLVVVLGWW